MLVDPLQLDDDHHHHQIVEPQQHDQEPIDSKQGIQELILNGMSKAAERNAHQQLQELSMQVQRTGAEEGRGL